MKRLFVRIILCIGFLAITNCYGEIVPIFKDDFSIYNVGRYGLNALPIDGEGEGGGDKH